MTGDSRYPTLSADTMASIRAVFFEECEENLGALETGLLALQDGAEDWEIINTVFRAVHSVKGGASIFGLDMLVDFAHLFESALSQMRSRELALDAGLIRTLLKAADVLTDLVHAARAGQAIDRAVIAPLVDELASLVAVTADEDDGFGDLVFTPVRVSLDSLEGPTAPDGLTIRFEPSATLYAKANDPVLLLQDLQRLGEMDVKLDRGALPPLNELQADESYLAWSIAHTSRDAAGIREVFDFVQGDCQLEILGETPPLDAEPSPAAPAPAASAAAPASPAPGPGQTIRVDLERVDRIIDLVSELVINQSILTQRMAAEALANRAEVGAVLDDMEKLTRDIQDSVMAIRAQPVKAVFQRMSRLVREVEAMTGKAVQLVTEGDATEVDRTVIERLSDPLTHMIRNAIDHGLESAERRLAAGKPAQGTVRIAASHRGGRIVIEVSDDGGGIDRQRVRAIAVERGIIAADRDLTNEEIDDLIFAPGFSTCEAVTDLSGRGVGMDVVRSSVQGLGGRISISSVEGQGTTFTLSLPLTLAVMDGMLVSVGGHSLVAPLTTLVESFQVNAGDVRRLGPSSAILTLRGAAVPLLDLAALMGFASDQADASRRVALLVEDDAGDRAALLVDDILGQQQVVIKSLEANYRNVPGVAAATILGDGRVALILDVSGILALQRRAFTPGPQTQAA